MLTACELSKGAKGKVRSTLAMFSHKQLAKYLTKYDDDCEATTTVFFFIFNFHCLSLALDKMLKYYKYPLKVWLATALLGTLVYLLCLLAGVLSEEGAQTGNVRNLNADNYFFMGVIAVIAWVCSFPCFITLWIVYPRLIDRNVSEKNIRIVLSIFGAVTGSLCLLSVYYFMMDELELKSVLELLVPYNAVLVGSIWYFKLRSKIEVANGI